MSASPTPPDATPSSSSGDALPRTQSSTSLRLARGEIPSTWTRPAEVVSTLPAPAPPSRLPILLGAALGLAVVIGGGVVVTRGSSAAAPAALPPPPVVATAPTPIESIPLPPPTSSTRVSEVAPEDQGGEPPKVEAPHVAAAPGEPAKFEPAKVEPAKVEPAKVEPAKVEPAHVETSIVNELPARKKARELTQKAIASLRANDFAGAEPVLVRAVLVDPSYADAWRHLGIARAQMGDRANARRAYKKYLTLAPDAPDAAQVKAILGE